METEVDLIRFKMIQSRVCATGYHIITLLLAAGVTYNQRILLSPAIGAMLTLRPLMPVFLKC